MNISIVLIALLSVSWNGRVLSVQDDSVQMEMMRPYKNPTHPQYVCPADCSQSSQGRIVVSRVKYDGKDTMSNYGMNIQLKFCGPDWQSIADDDTCEWAGITSYNESGTDAWLSVNGQMRPIRHGDAPWSDSGQSLVLHQSSFLHNQSVDSQGNRNYVTPIAHLLEKWSVYEEGDDLRIDVDVSVKILADVKMRAWYWPGYFGRGVDAQPGDPLDGYDEIVQLEYGQIGQTPDLIVTPHLQPPSSSAYVRRPDDPQTQGIFNCGRMRFESGFAVANMMPENMVVLDNDFTGGFNRGRFSWYPTIPEHGLTPGMAWSMSKGEVRSKIFSILLETP